MLPLLPFFFLLTCILYTAPVSAETKLIEAQASYMMDDSETPLFAEAMVLQLAKQTAIKEAVAYVAEVTKAKHPRLTMEEIQAIAGAGLKMESIEKTRTLVGETLRFAVKISTSLTTERMEELANRIKGRPLGQEYKKLQEDYAAFARDVDRPKNSEDAGSTAAADRDAPQSRLREKEQSLARIQKRENALYERLITGEDLHAKAEQQLTDERDRVKKRTMTVSTLVDEIAQRGHEITVGEPEVKARLEEKGQADLYFPVSITGNPAMRGKIKEALASSGGELNNASYRKFERRLANVWFVLEVLLRNGDRRVCYVPTHLTKFQADGEFVTMEDGRSNWKIRMTLPLSTIKEIVSAQGKFMEAMPGSACGVARTQ
jgi:hypothetical protein